MNPFERGGLHGWISWPPGLLTEAGLKNPGRLHTRDFLPPNMMNFLNFRNFVKLKVLLFSGTFCFCKILKICNMKFKTLSLERCEEL
jgi:hypothetical protein